MKWQEFERIIKEVCDFHGFKTSFRVVFKDSEGKSEIDVVAERFQIVLCIDAKFYSAKRYRASQLRKEAKKHVKRCKRYSKIKRCNVVPVVVSFIDDSINFHEGCIVVPFDCFNDFLENIYYYLALFNYL